MSDRESGEDTSVLDDVTVNKYKMTADVVNKILGDLIKLCVPGAKIVELCETGDRRILEETAKCFKKDKNIKKGVAFPTSISLNNIICHYSPINGEDSEPAEIHENDVVKIDLGAHIDGCAAVVGHTFVVGASQSNKVTGRKADAIIAANTAAGVVLRMLRPGIENFKASEMVLKAVSDFNCRFVERHKSHQMKPMIYDADKSIIFNPTEETKKAVEKCTFELNDVWNIDILVSSGDGKPREHNARTTIYLKNETLYQLKMKASRQLYSELTSKSVAYPFNIRTLEDIRKARLGITECVKHDVLQAFPVYSDKDDEIVAQFRFTVLLMPNGPMRITGLLFDPTLYKSDHKVKDNDVIEVLRQPIKSQSKKKNVESTA